MACNYNFDKSPPPPPVERQNYPIAPPPTPIIEETHSTLDISEMDFQLEEDFTFPVLVGVTEENAPIAVTEEKPAEARNANPKEESLDANGSKKRKPN